MDASTLIDLALYLLGLTAPDEPEDPNRGTRPVGG